MFDNNPLMLCTEIEKIKTQKKICFETPWINHADFMPKIQQIWEKEVIAKNAVET